MRLRLRLYGSCSSAMGLLQRCKRVIDTSGNPGEPGKIGQGHRASGLDRLQDEVTNKSTHPTVEVSTKLSEAPSLEKPHTSSKKFLREIYFSLYTR